MMHDSAGPYSTHNTPVTNRVKSKGRQKNSPAKERSTDSLEQSESTTPGSTRRNKKAKTAESRDSSEVASSSNTAASPDSKMITLLLSAPSTSTGPASARKSPKAKPAASFSDSESIKTEAVVAPPGQVKSENVDTSMDSTEPPEAKEVRQARASKAAKQKSTD
jgi:hypothetical protein